MRVSIRHQLLFPLLTLMIGMVAMVSWIVYASARRAHEQVDRNLTHVAGTVQKVTPFLRSLQILSLMKELSGAEFLVVDRERRPLRDSENRVLTTLDQLPAHLPDPQPDEQRIGLGEVVAIGDQAYFSRGVHLHPETQDQRFVYLFLPEPLLQEAVWQAVRPGLLVGGVVALGSVLLAFGIHQRLTKRILALEQRTRIIAAGDFSPMPLPSRSDELRSLAQSVNEMAQQLAQYQETSKRTERLRLLGQVSGGLAHQLRNGAAGAKLALQLHARECPLKRSEPIDVALRQLALVEMHLQKFLDLGKAMDLHPVACNLVQLLDEVVMLLRPQCHHAGIGLAWKKPDTALSLRADPHQLSQAILNVVSNAIEAAGPEGRVEVGFEVEGPNRVCIEVWDSGPGPSSEVAQKLFEPFVTGKPEGVGLGLAVAKEILGAHGGGITWQRIRGGTSFFLRIADCENPMAK